MSGAKRGRGKAILRRLPPRALRHGNHTRSRFVPHHGVANNLAELVEHPHAGTVGDSPALRIARVYEYRERRQVVFAKRARNQFRCCWTDELEGEVVARMALPRPRFAPVIYLFYLDSGVIEKIDDRGKARVSMTPESR